MIYVWLWNRKLSPISICYMWLAYCKVVLPFVVNVLILVALQRKAMSLSWAGRFLEAHLPGQNFMLTPKM